jgi:hypothetical protein
VVRRKILFSNLTTEPDASTDCLSAIARTSDLNGAWHPICDYVNQESPFSTIVGLATLKKCRCKTMAFEGLIKKPMNEMELMACI